jgi:hypothetical protein
MLRFRKSKQVKNVPSTDNEKIAFVADFTNYGGDILTVTGSTEASSRTSSTDSVTAPNEIDTDSAAQSPKGNNADPYADVRVRMEALSLHHRMVHAYHTEESSSVAFHGDPVIPFFAAWTTYLGYAVLIFVGHVRDFCSKIFQTGRYVANKKNTGCPADDNTQYAPLLKSFENFYTKRLYHRIQDCFNRPLASTPGAKVNVLERISSDGNKTMQVLGKLDNLTEEEAKVYTKGEHYATVSGDRVTRRCLNLGSYNYLDLRMIGILPARRELLEVWKVYLLVWEVVAWSAVLQGCTQRWKRLFPNLLERKMPWL